MKKFKVLLVSALLLIAAGALGACGKGTEKSNKIYLASIELSALPTGDIVVGDVFTLTVTEKSPDTATDKGIIWTSTDTSKATVADGLVTALAPGNVTITATAKDGGEPGTGGPAKASRAFTVIAPKSGAVITSAAAFKWMSNSSAPGGASYTLGADIDFGGAVLNQLPDIKSFDGKGYTLSNFKLNDGGLFGIFTGTFKNVSIVNAEMTLAPYTGGDGAPTADPKGIIADELNGGTIENVYLDCQVKSTVELWDMGWYWSGVAVGIMNGTAEIKNSVIMMYDATEGRSPTITGQTMPVFGSVAMGTQGDYVTPQISQAKITNVFVIHDSNSRLVTGVISGDACGAEYNGKKAEGLAYWGQNINTACTLFAVDDVGQDPAIQIDANKTVGTGGFGLDWAHEWKGLAVLDNACHVIPENSAGFDYSALNNTVWDLTGSVPSLIKPATV
jgi:hypothetical protein